DDLRRKARPRRRGVARAGDPGRGPGGGRTARPDRGAVGRAARRSRHGTVDAGPVPRRAGGGHAMMRVAVVGAGVAGLAAARALTAAGHRVTLYEAAPHPGGHVYTVDAGECAVDLGFIVCNRERYPAFFALLGELGIATRRTTMSFSVAIPG